jgi:hypothetical protein
MAAKQVLYFLSVVCKWVQWTTWDFNIFCNILRLSFDNMLIDDIRRLPNFAPWPNAMQLWLKHPNWRWIEWTRGQGQG